MRSSAGTTPKRSSARSKARAPAVPLRCSSTTRTDRCAIFLLDELPADVRVIFGNRKPFSMVQDADGGFDGAFFVGYHGAAGDADAVLCHTYTPSVIYEVRINGDPLQRGDHQRGLCWDTTASRSCSSAATERPSKACKRRCPGCAAWSVKESIGNFAANSMTPASAQRAIRQRRPKRR